MGYYNTFVVKVWCDDCGELVRGHIQHVSSQELSYFLNLESMNDFILSHFSPPPDGSVIQGERPGELPFLAEGYVGQDE